MSITAGFMLIDKCNLRCSMCHYATRSTGALLPYERFEQIVSELQSIRIFGKRVTTIRFDGNREPLLYDRITEAVGYAASNGFNTHVITNGLLLTEEMSAALIRAGLSKLTVSIAGMSIDTYRRYQAANKNESSAEKQFFTVLENVKGFIRIKEQMKRYVNVQINYLLSPDSAPEARSAYFFWRDVGVNDLFYQTPYLHVDENDFHKYGRRQCSGVPTDFIINPKGDVHPCCFWEAEDVILGNCFEHGFASVLKSDGFNAFFDALARFDTTQIPTACKRCTGLSSRPDIRNY